jgi:hypothetical protein
MSSMTPPVTQDLRGSLPPIRRVEGKDLSREMNWLRLHSRDYAGQWVAIDGDRLIAHDFDANRFFAEVDRSGVDDPLFAHLEAADERPSLGGLL